MLFSRLRLSPSPVRLGGGSLNGLPATGSNWQWKLSSRNATPRKVPTDTVSRQKPKPLAARHCAWPASDLVIPKVRSFLIDCAAARGKTLIVPYPDEDGLCAGVIIHRTLATLGLPSSCIDVHLLGKAATIHDEAERLAMRKKTPKYIIVLGHGNHSGPPIIDSADTRTLIIDNHYNNGSPKDAMFVTSYHTPPVAACALLTYEICKKLHPDVDGLCGYLCVLGTHAYQEKDVNWITPLPDMTAVFHIHQRRLINDAFRLVRASRFTPAFDISSVWQALLASETPKDLLDNKSLLSARDEVETEKRQAIFLEPTFSSDKKFAVFRIHSEYQIHSAISVNMARRYIIPGLQIIMVYNTGYLPGMVAFSCQAPCQDRFPQTDVIHILKDMVSGSAKLAEQMSEYFVRGPGEFVITKNAGKMTKWRRAKTTAGIISLDAFRELLALMKIVAEDMLLDNEKKFRKILPTPKTSFRTIELTQANMTAT